uniref:Spermatosis and centriole associated 1 n=1 Tax=Catagonus wagneri TaxID=51154 RepID=A0A8C3X8G2_9CETA
MSLLTNYEGLRHQIERLVRENEELKKLVRLIRENHELKSAIKTQAGGLGISGFSSGLGEVAAGPPQHQGNCVFLPPSPAAANEPVLEEAGIVALAPLADILNSPQPGPAAAPIVSPLTAPLNVLLPCPGPVSQSGRLTRLLTSPVAVTPAGTLASSLGLPSTGPLTPSCPLAGPAAVSQNSPLMAPMTGSVAVSLSGPLLTSTAAPPGVSQNLPANPVSNLVLSEPPRVRLAEPLHGFPPGPHPSAAGGPAAASKAPHPTEHPQEQEPLSLTFVGAPIQTSTPVGALGTAFSYSASDARTQPGGPQGQAAPPSVPASTASPSIASLAPAPTPAPQAAANPPPPSTPHASPTRPSPTPHSPPRNPHSPPPRTSSSPASVSDPRGPRPEPSRKSFVELERKLAHRKGSKFPDGSRGLPEPQR